MEQTYTIVQVIQAMLAPGLMISACGLLLLSMNNKYSLVVNRIRLLNEERRRFISKLTDGNFKFNEEVRLKSISLQLQKLQYRAWLIRNAVFSYSIAVAFFVVSSLIIGIQFAFQNKQLDLLILLFFILGMILVLIGITFAAIETLKGYQIVVLDVKADE